MSVVKVPTGVEPIFLTEKGLLRHDMKTGDEIYDVVAFKIIPKQAILDEVQEIGFVSDFHPQRTKFAKYAGENVLFVFDPESVYEQNFYWVSTPELFESELVRLEKEEQDQLAKQKKEDAEGRFNESAILQLSPEEQFQLKFSALLEQYNLGAFDDFEVKEPSTDPNKWQPQGNSIDEIESEQEKLQREPLRVEIQWVDCDISKRAPEFVDSSTCDSSFESKFVPCVDEKEVTETSQSHKKAQLKGGACSALALAKWRIRDAAVQCASNSQEVHVQTPSVARLNAAMQYRARRLTDKESEAAFASREMKDFAMRACAMFEYEQKSTQVEMRMFADPLASLLPVSVHEDRFHEVPALREAFSFVDLTHSRYKYITSIQWHPTERGVVAVSCGLNVDFEARTRSSGDSRTMAILVWDTLDDLLKPRYVLIAPCDVISFKFHPTEPLLIVAGLENGQLAMWDVRHETADRKEVGESTQFASKADNRQTKHDSRDGLTSDAMKMLLQSKASLAELGMPSEDGNNVVTIEPRFLSSMERSHLQAVTSLSWLPSQSLYDKRGKRLPLNEQPENELDSTQVPNADLRPLQLVSVAGDGVPLVWDVRTTFGRSKRRGTTSGLAPWQPLCALPINETIRANDGTSYLQAVEARTLESPAAQLLRQWVKSEDLGVDEPDLEDCFVFSDTSHGFGFGCFGKEGGSKVRFRVPNAHDNLVRQVHLAPFDADLALTCGERCFAVWKRNYSQPLFVSPSARSEMVDALWSTHRKGVIFAVLQDGAVHVWDILSSTLEPLLDPFPSASCAVSSSCFEDSALASRHSHMLAVGDRGGTVHLLRLPSVLRRATPNESELFDAFIARQCMRIDNAELGESNVGVTTEDTRDTQAENTVDATRFTSGKDASVSVAGEATDEVREAQYCKLTEVLSQRLNFNDGVALATTDNAVDDQLKSDVVD
ncbi:MAG: hypothetical protein MHM6MM_003699 [Cercozoa sp. M6MM]